MSEPVYDESSIKSLDWKEHIRLRPGMYIGKLGDGSSPDDGIYILLKEAVDNSIDEFVMGHGKEIRVDIDESGRCEVRDHGRGIPLGKLMDCAARINTGAKYDSEAFKKSVGLNGVGIKAVNALSNFFEIQAFRDGETKAIEFSKGEVVEEMKRVCKPGGEVVIVNHFARDEGPLARLERGGELGDLVVAEGLKDLAASQHPLLLPEGASLQATSYKVQATTQYQRHAE